MGNVEKGRKEFKVKPSVAERQLRKYNQISIILALIMCVFGTVAVVILCSRPLNADELRLDMEDVQYKVENGDLSVLDKYNALLSDNEGNVIYSSMKSHKVGEKVNLHIFSYGGLESRDNHHYITPIVRGGVQSGLLYIELEDLPMYFPPVILIPVICLAILFFVLHLRKKFIHNDIVVPIIHLNQMATEIARGNYKSHYTYETSNEIGKLCRQIELLRDELDISTENEKKLRENEKMLLACISHDLKTPLATISGFAEGIRDGIASDETAVKNYANTIIKKTRLLNRLINDIIENTAGEVGELKISIQELMADDYIEGVLASLMPDVENSGLKLSNENIPRVLIAIDPDKVYQVFQNIIGNAIKYTNKGGSITVKAVQLERVLEISIKDNGQGIAAADVPYIFDKFFRGERARTQDIGGSGLGLSIVKNIIEKQGGEVECESEAGEGTEISFTLPLA